MNRLTKSTTLNENILPDETLRGRLIIRHIHRHNVLRSRNIVVSCTFCLYVLGDLYHSLEVDDGHDKADDEKDDEKEGPNFRHGVSRVEVSGGVEIDFPNESHDAGAEAEGEHDVEHQPGEEAEDEVPGDGHHQENLTDYLAAQPGQ